MSGRLTLCATPIGNLSDAPPRLAETLRNADVVFAEDTRRTRVLLNALGVDADVESYFAGNEAMRTDELRDRFAQGQHVALVTDAGMPAISDPGSRAVRAAHEMGAVVTVVPGPSAATAAVAVSGFAVDRFAFEGFLPRRGAERVRRLAAIAREDRLVVLFAAPSRVVGDLADLADVCGGDRSVVVTREMTKLHEEVWRGTLDEAVAEWSERRPKGEFTLVLDATPTPMVAIDDAVREVRSRVGKGEPMSAAVRSVAEVTGLGRRSLYQAALAEDATPS